MIDSSRFSRPSLLPRNSRTTFILAAAFRPSFSVPKNRVNEVNQTAQRLELVDENATNTIVGGRGVSPVDAEGGGVFTSGPGGLLLHR